MKTIGLAGSVLLLAAQIGWADCERPEMPAIPDGSQAERAEMLEAHSSVQSYIERGNAYLECLKQEEAAEVADEKATEESIKTRMESYNGTVDEMQQVGERFNAALKQFNSRQN